MLRTPFTGVGVGVGAGAGELDPLGTLDTVDDPVGEVDVVPRTVVGVVVGGEEVDVERGQRQNTSVKVPPRSIANLNWSLLIFTLLWKHRNIELQS